MKYRLEVLDDNEIVVHNVETGLILGRVDYYLADHPSDPARRDLPWCTCYNFRGEELATIGFTVSDPLTMAPVAVANFEGHYGFPGFEANASAIAVPFRIERRLGTLLADVCIVLMCSLVEHDEGRVKAETKKRYIGSIIELHRIWYASRFGSFDDEDRRADDPYFSNPSGARMSFAQAAQVYGMEELRRRFPQVSDGELYQLLAWPLELLTALVDKLRSS